MEIRDKLFDWLSSLLFQSAGVDTTVVIAALLALLFPRERRSPVALILAIGLVMFFGGHLVLRITVPGQPS